MHHFKRPFIHNHGSFPMPLVDGYQESMPMPLYSAAVLCIFSFLDSCQKQKGIVRERLQTTSVSYAYTKIPSQYPAILFVVSQASLHTVYPYCLHTYLPPAQGTITATHFYHKQMYDAIRPAPTHKRTTKQSFTAVGKIEDPPTSQPTQMHLYAAL